MDELIEHGARQMFEAWVKRIDPARTQLEEEESVWESQDDQCKTLWRTDFLSALRAIEASGKYRVVPVWPTDEWLGIHPLMDAIVAQTYRDSWKAWLDRLAASPKVPT